MSQCRLLLDANAYFRLARSIRPLCGVEFGAAKYCVHVLKDVDEEFSKSTRLQSKFHWVNEPEYQRNRQPPLTLSRVELAAAKQAVSYIRSHVRARALGLSPIDIKTLAACAAIPCPVVTVREIARYWAYEMDKPANCDTGLPKAFRRVIPQTLETLPRR